MIPTVPYSLPDKWETPYPFYEDATARQYHPGPFKHKQASLQSENPITPLPAGHLDLGEPLHSIIQLPGLDFFKAWMDCYRGM